MKHLIIGIPAFLMLITVNFTVDADRYTKKVDKKISGGARFKGIILKENKSFMRGTLTFGNGEILKVKQGGPNFQSARGEMTLKDGTFIKIARFKAPFDRPRLGPYNNIQGHFNNGISFYGKSNNQGVLSNLQLYSYDIATINKIDKMVFPISEDQSISPYTFTKIEKEKRGDKIVSVRITPSVPVNEFILNKEQALGALPGFYGYLKNQKKWSGTFVLPDGSLLVTPNLNNEVPEGYISQYFSDGTHLRGRYINGYKHGFFEEEKNSGTMYGRFNEDQKDGWWYFKQGNTPSKIIHYKNDEITEEYHISYHHECKIDNFMESSHFFSIDDTCKTLLFSKESGIIIKNADIQDGELIAGEVFPAYKKGLEGKFTNRIFEGTAYNEYGYPEFKGTIVNNKREGSAICIDKGIGNTCLWKNNERIDGYYLQQTSLKGIRKWESQCKNDIKIVEKNSEILNRTMAYSGCSLSENIDFIKESWEDDTAGNPMNCLECGHTVRDSLNSFYACRNKTKSSANILKTGYIRISQRLNCCSSFVP